MCILCQWPDHARALERIQDERELMRASILAGRPVHPKVIEQSRLDFTALAGELGVPVMDVYR